ncbi:MAG TPA: hypothetical protein QF700_09245 [Prochlorococcus sp.]|nr:hypothetical protein [Prochlorococcus sp.]
MTWLGWEWDDVYLSPYLNAAAVSKASNIQARSAINAKSVVGWMYCQAMLHLAIDVLLSSKRFSGVTD